MTTNDKNFPQLIFLGILRSSVGFPLEHPLELMKITSQANPKLSSIGVIETIMKDRGIYGFSNTIMTNFPRRLMKEVVRWPMIGYTHEKLINGFPGMFTRDGTNSKFVTGICVAGFDSLFISPIEQLMAYRIKEKEKYTNFFKDRFSKDGIPSLYRGAQVNFIRQGVIWTTLMTINNETKIRLDQIDTMKDHPYMRQGITSVLIASGLVSWGLPIDFVKTRIQMDKELQKMKVKSVIPILYRRHGLLGFYAGALPTFIHSVFHATLGGYILDKIFE